MEGFLYLRIVSPKPGELTLRIMTAILLDEFKCFLERLCPRQIWKYFSVTNRIKAWIFLHYIVRTKDKGQRTKLRTCF
jgi:hypothetical protein